MFNYLVSERMAGDPKYAGLPGIATGQPDTFETFSDHDLTGVGHFEELKV